MNTSEKLTSTSNDQGSELEKRGTIIEELEDMRSTLENNVSDLKNRGASMEKQIDHLTGEKERLDKLVVICNKCIYCSQLDIVYADISIESKRPITSASQFIYRLEVDHDKLVNANAETTNNLSNCKKQCITITDQRDSMDNENKRMKAENTKLSIELTDFKKALARFDLCSLLCF